MAVSNCSQGNSPDVLLRLAMPLGPFNAPYGLDCYFNLVAFQVLGAALIIVNLALFAVVLADILPLHRRRRENGGLIQLGSCALLMACFSHVAFVLCGLYAQLACRAVWVVCTLCTLVYVMAYLAKFSLAGLKLLHNLGSQASITSVHGGPVLGVLHAVLVSTAAVSLVVSAAVSAAVFDPRNEAPALAAQQAHYVSMAVWAACAIFGEQAMARTYISTVESINSSALPMRGGGGGDTPPARRNSNDEMMLLLTRFKLANNGVRLAFPISVGLNLLHATVLPPFAYLALFQLFNSTFVGMVGWFGLTSTRRRRRALRIATCGLVGRGREDGAEENNNYNTNERGSKQVTAAAAGSSLYAPPTAAATPPWAYKV